MPHIIGWVQITWTLFGDGSLAQVKLSERREDRRVYWLRYWTGDSTCRLRDGSSSLIYCTKYPECSTLWRDIEDTGIVWKLRETDGMHRPELDGNSQNMLETTVSYKTRARLTPTLTHVITYELVTSGAEDDTMSYWHRTAVGEIYMFCVMGPNPDCTN